MSNELLINKIDISPRAFYCLMRHGIKDLRELSEYTQQAISSIPNVGYKTYADILHVCEKYGVNLKDLEFKSILHIYECIFTTYRGNNPNDTLTITQNVIALNENDAKIAINKSWKDKVYDTMKIKRIDIYNGMIL